MTAFKASFNWKEIPTASWDNGNEAKKDARVTRWVVCKMDIFQVVWVDLAIGAGERGLHILAPSSIPGFAWTTCLPT